METQLFTHESAGAGDGRDRNKGLRVGAGDSAAAGGTLGAD